MRIEDGALVLEFVDAEAEAAAAAEKLRLEQEAAATAYLEQAKLEAQVAKAAIQSLDPALAVCGSRVDGKLLLLWVVPNSGGQLLVHGLDPRTNERMGHLCLAADDWSFTGYGALETLDTAQVSAELSRFDRRNINGWCNERNEHNEHKEHNEDSQLGLLLRVTLHDDSQRATARVTTVEHHQHGAAANFRFTSDVSPRPPSSGAGTL